MKSQLADVNIQPSVGMFAVYGVIHCGCFVKQLLNFIPHYNKTFDSYRITIFVTFVGGAVNRVARYPVFQGSSRISAPISRLPERSYPGDEISRISITTCQSPVTTHGETLYGSCFVAITSGVNPHLF